MIKRFLSPLCGLLLAASCFVTTACDRTGAPAVTSRITPESVAKIQPGMTRAQVEALLGPPNTVETKDMVIFKKHVATYIEGKNSVSVEYKNEEVQSKNSTVGAPSTQ
jgi:outer membrane protein assembly factor BamE (lipoprotein component of BamABCDE complex)